MPDSHVDNLKVGVSGTPGTGTATVGSAASGCRGFVAGDDGKTFSGRWTDGTAWETATGCLYTHSGTTLTRGTLKESSTGSAISLTSAAVFECAPLAELGNRVEQIALQDVTITDAAVTMQVGKRYRGSIAAFTADRTYTLPAVFAAGDMVEVCITEGDDTYELLVTAASGDTLNGIAGGTEWSRVFITGEVVRFRGDVANSAWVVDYDGRIPCHAVFDLSTAESGTKNAATYYAPTSVSGAWTAQKNIGDCGNTSNSRVTCRRAGVYSAQGFAGSTTSLASGQYWSVRIWDGTTTHAFTHSSVASAIAPSYSCGVEIPLTDGQYLEFQTRCEAASKYCSANGTAYSVKEVLP